MMLHIMMDIFLEIVTDPDHPPVDIRERLMFCLIEHGALNDSIGGFTSSILDASDKALFQSLKTNLISKRCAATLKIPDSKRLAVKDHVRRAQLQVRACRLGPMMGTSYSQDWINVIAELLTPKILNNGQCSFAHDWA